MESVVVYKICDSTRLRRFVIPAFGTLTSLLEQGSTTLEKNITQVLTEQDGCRITTDLVLHIFKDKLLMLLEADEMWLPIETLNVATDAGGTQTKDVVSGKSKAVQQNQSPNEQITVIDANPSMFFHHAQPAANIISVIPISSCTTSSEPGTSHGLASILQVEPRGDCITVTEIDDADSCQQHTVINAPVNEKASNPDVKIFIEEAENSCLNVGSKRAPEEEVNVSKSSKKFASSELKFQCFQIKWSKIGDSIVNRLQDLQKFRNENPGKCAPRNLQLSKTDWAGITNSVVDQMRVIDNEIKASVMEKVAKDIIGKYPCLSVLDDDGFGSGKDYVAIKHKMLNRNCYLNRFKDEAEQPSSTPKTGIGRKRNVRAGTSKEYWKKSSKECTKDVLSTLARDEPGLLTQEFLESSQSYVRYRLDEDKPLKDVLADFPVLRRKHLLDYHFESATGVAAEAMAQYFTAKRSKLVEYANTGRKTNNLSEAASDVDIIRFLCDLLGENLDDVIISKEIGTRIDGITTDCSGPVIVAVDCGNAKIIYYVFAEQVRLTEGTESVIAAIADLVSVHYVHNFMYMRQISKFLEFVQEYFFKILPASGSKSNAPRKGQQQRTVKKVIKSISEYCAQ